MYTRFSNDGWIVLCIVVKLNVTIVKLNVTDMHSLICQRAAHTQTHKQPHALPASQGMHSLIPQRIWPYILSSLNVFAHACSHPSTYLPVP